MLKRLYRFLHPKFQTISLDYKVDQRPRYGHGLPAHDMLDEIIGSHRSEYSERLEKILEYKESIWSLQERMGDNMEGKAVSWLNGYLPGLDIIGLYGMIRELQPKRYIEVGSGNSTKVVHQAIADAQCSTKIISIDPQPRAEITGIADLIIKQPVEEVDLSIFAQLEAGDILFIDNSHRILPNSDSMVFYLEILPRLKPGVIVHIHDVYLPYDYPQFMCDRSYSEQYGLAIALLSNRDRYEILLPCYYVSEDEELREVIAPVWEDERVGDAERHGGSFWMRVG